LTKIQANTHILKQTLLKHNSLTSAAHYSTMMSWWCN